MSGEWIITEGPTVEQASIVALDRLGVAADEADIEVVARPKRGAFGLTRRSARVVARVAPVEPPGRIERSNRRPLRRKAKKKSQRSSGDRQPSERQMNDRQPNDSGPKPKKPKSQQPRNNQDNADVRTRKLIS